jgi:hypothetical protein
MRAKTIVTAVLLLFVAVSVVYLITKETTGTKPATVLGEHSDAQASNKLSSGTTDGEDKVIVYYFHGDKRCQTCKTIEAYAEEAVRNAFADELASGELEWHAVNVDESENNHFIDDYQLATRSVVLVKVTDGVEKRWENLEKVWQLVGTKPAFLDYIIKNTNEFLSGADL